MVTGSVSVKVQFRGFLCRIVNQEEMELDVACGASLEDVVIMLVDHCGDELRKVALDTAGAVYGGIVISIGENTIPYQQFAETKIVENCIITLIPLTAGG